MTEIILYTSGCPKCKVLKNKLDSKNIKYSICSDVEQMTSKGFVEVPKLQVDNVVMNFSEAVKWINQQ